MYLWRNSGSVAIGSTQLSQHLKELKNAGLITGTVDGQKSCYCINWKAFEKFSAEFNFVQQVESAE